MTGTKELVDLLNIRLTATLRSPSDSLFYQNTHAYIDLIVKNSTLYSILIKAEAEYSKKHSEIWHPRTEDEKILDERERLTYKLERFNLYTANFALPFVRIYSPIEDYKTSDDPTHRQDPVALLMLYGIKSTYAEYWAKNRPTVSYKDALKELKVYNRWFDGKRKEYEEDLKQFHVDFLSTILTTKEDTLNIEKIITKRPPINLDPRTGSFSFSNVTGELNPKGQEFKVLSTLLTSKDYFAEYEILIASYRPYKPESSKVLKPELALIIKNIKEKLGILQTEYPNPDIFLNIKNVGYRLVTFDHQQKQKKP